jgi:FMN phosphatase YigB (HAD superfamily)
MRPDDRLLVLDVHGVIFTNPMLGFLADTAREVGRDPEALLHEWAERWRRRFWLGEVSPERLWATFFPDADPATLTAALESRYRPGPLFEHLDTFDEPMWLLSNHRTDWLLARLERYGLRDRFERIYVSDAIGFVKPEPGAFRYVRERAPGRHIRYIDDKTLNVAVAAGILDESVSVTEAIPVS